ncbi:MAG: hypothetical protein IKD75_02320 [Prevotella sp.]|nr:hypothetical protein [Prevotella sp.]
MNKVEINKNIKLSEHFTLGELTKTSVKSADDNIPSHVAIENLKRVCKWLEVLRTRYNNLYGEEEPIIINSGYRSPEVNKKVGGSPTSNHLTGCAADIKVFGIEQAMRYAVILLNYADNTMQEFDELLIERSKKGAYWLHFAVRPKENRRKVMFMQT